MRWPLLALLLGYLAMAVGCYADTFTKILMTSRDASAENRMIAHALAREMKARMMHHEFS